MGLANHCASLTVSMAPQHARSMTKARRALTPTMLPRAATEAIRRKNPRLKYDCTAGDEDEDDGEDEDAGMTVVADAGWLVARDLN